jgi:hypothetical protein
MVNKPEILKLMLLVIALVFPGAAGSGDQTTTGAEISPESWPKVAGLHETYHFSSAKKAAVDLVLLGGDGKGLYSLQCHNYTYEGDPDFVYSGEFECKLVPVNGPETYSTLFTENPRQSADWDSRARFFSSDLVGDCADYPDYGAKRNFRLRGMHIILEISNSTFRQSYIEVD